MLYKEDQEEKKTNKKEVSIKRRNFLKDDPFDPEDLPLHLGKYPIVVKAWLMFVQHRKDQKKPLNRGAYTLLINKMLCHTPDEIVAELHQAIERNWLTIFYNDNKQPTQGLPSQQPKRQFPADNSAYGNMMGIRDVDFKR